MLPVAADPSRDTAAPMLSSPKYHMMPAARAKIGSGQRARTRVVKGTKSLGPSLESLQTQCAAMSLDHDKRLACTASKPDSFCT